MILPICCRLRRADFSLRAPLPAIARIRARERAIPRHAEILPSATPPILRHYDATPRRSAAACHIVSMREHTPLATTARLRRVHAGAFTPPPRCFRPQSAASAVHVYARKMFVRDDASHAAAPPPLPRLA